MSIYARVETALSATTQPLLLNPVADGDTGTTAIQVQHTIYLPPPFVLILLSGELRPVEA